MITSKQRAYLRKLSQNLDPSFQIGKGGINENIIKEIKDALEKNELVKITLLDTMVDQSDDDKDTIADILSKKTLSNVVSRLGKKITLYKRSSKKVKILFPDELEKQEKDAKKKAKKLRAKTSTIMRARDNRDKEKDKYKKNTKEKKSPIRNKMKSSKKDI